MNYRAALTLLLIAGCSSTKQPARENSTIIWPDSNGMRQVLGAVIHYGDGPEIGIPEKARVGEPIPVTVTTYGGGCIREDTTIVVVNSLTADISPYQRIPTAAETCTAELRLNRRSLLVTFAVPGHPTVKIRGRAVPGDTVIRLLRSILVQ